MLKLLSHLVCLFIELLDLNLTGSNITLKFLNLIVEHELKLLKLLRFLLQIVYSLILVPNRGLSLLYLALLRVDLLDQGVSLLLQIGEFLLLLMYILLCLLLLGLGLLVVVGHECQLGLALHAGVDDLRELFLVLLLDAVDIFPGVVFDLLALFLVLGHEFLAGFAQRGGLSLLLLEL